MGLGRRREAVFLILEQQDLRVYAFTSFSESLFTSLLWCFVGWGGTVLLGGVGGARKKGIRRELLLKY